MVRLFRTSMIAVALLALASPIGAHASLSNWSDEGSPIASKVVLPLSGSFYNSGGTACSDVQMQLALDPGSTGEITSFAVPDPSKCEVVGTLKALGCTSTTGVTPESTPWTVHNTSTEVTITNMKLLYHYQGGAFCPKTVTVSGSIEATPDDVEEIESFTLGGSLSSSIGSKVSVEGTQQIDPPEACFYIKTFGL